MKKVLSLVIVLILALSLVACSNDLVGVWEDEDGMTVEFTKDKIIAEDFEMDYETDGDEITITFMDIDSTGFYKVKGDKLYMYEEGQDYKDGDMLTKVK